LAKLLILITRYPTKTMYSSVDGLIGKIFVFFNNTKDS